MFHFNEHANRKIQEVIKLGWHWKISIGVKTLLFLAVCRLAVVYVSSLWWTLCSFTRRIEFQTLLKKALMTISRIPWFVRNITIHNRLEVPTSDSFVTLLQSFSHINGVLHIAELRRRNGLPETCWPRPIAILLVMSHRRWKPQLQLADTSITS